MDVADKPSFDDDRTGMDVCFDPALFAYREMLLVMGNRAFYLTFDDEVFVCYQVALEYQRRSDD